MRDIDDYEHFWINSEKSISPYACNKIYHNYTIFHFKCTQKTSLKWNDTFYNIYL